jgi:hypothetical protein
MENEPAGAGRIGTAACGSCRHFDKRNPNDLFCRRFPPQLVVIRDRGKDVVRQFYPNTHPVLDWCGEHEESS